MVDSSVCMNEARSLHVDSAIAADFKGCCNDLALVCPCISLSLSSLPLSCLANYFTCHLIIVGVSFYELLFLDLGFLI